MMKAFFLFAPKFLEWPLAIARELRARNPEASFSGLATGSRVVFDRVAANEDPAILPLDWLDDLERNWLATHCDDARLAQYEEMLGQGVLRRIIISDRQIGNGLVSGGVIPRTKLMDMAEDAEMLRRYVLGLLDYIFETFELNRPDLVFCYAVAGAVSLGISQVCRHLKIPFARLSPTRVGTRYIIDDSPEGLLSPVRRVYEKALHDPKVLEHVLPMARKYLEDFRARPQQPDYTKYNRARFMRGRSMSGIARQMMADLKGVGGAIAHNQARCLRATTEWQLTLHHFLVSLRGRILARNGPFGATGDLPKRPFAYFPLHVDPEASTMVLAPMHTDQISVVEALAKSLPLGMHLVVKEHIPMFGRRPAGFYKRLRRMPGVILASPFEESLSLIRQASLTCVITGTAACEAMLLKRPVLIMGNSPYLAIGEGAVRCSDMSGLPEVVLKVLNLRPADDERLVCYLAALMDQSFDFPTDLFWGDVTEETVRRNPEILNSICSRLLTASSTHDSDAAHIC